MRMVDCIEKKVNKEELTHDEIQFIVDGFVSGEIPDYQMSALMMAIVLNDMNEREAADLTLSMMCSGDTVDLSDLPGIKVDKHSSGGVGDTTTLVIAPLVAACGGTVAKMSGRGNPFGRPPKMTSPRFSRKKDTPMAVMRAEIRGAFRTGL